jgi:hypothetical protein
MGKKGETLPVSNTGNRSKDSKWWSLSLSLTLAELGEYLSSLRYSSWVAKRVLNQVGVIQTYPSCRDKGVL